MEIMKSSRYQRIMGLFGELLVANWLSRSGFEVVLVDHTGIDLIAYHPETERRLGITVKSRTRVRGTEYDSVNLFQSRKRDREKLLYACKAFESEPWIAVYVETLKYADLFITSLKNYDEKYRNSEGGTDTWKMSSKYRVMYDRDPGVFHIRLNFEITGMNKTIFKKV